MKETIIVRNLKSNDKVTPINQINKYRIVSIFCFLLHFMIFHIDFFPVLRTDILSSLKFRNNIVIKTKIFDSISANVDLLDFMKNLTFLNKKCEYFITEDCCFHLNIHKFVYSP
jgi:hypothetical protein